MQEVNFDSDWKLVTVYVGTNDLCAYCNDQVSVSENRTLAFGEHTVHVGVVLLSAGEPVPAELHAQPHARLGHAVQSGEILYLFTKSYHRLFAA